MISELVVGLYGHESLMMIVEGETAHFARDIREVELAVVSSEGEQDFVVAVIGIILLLEATRRALGPAAAPFPSEDLDNLAIAPPGHAHNSAAYFNNRKISIYGGSNEIQRNILAKGMMGK